MQVAILERFSQGKAPSGYSEDRIVDTPGIFGVLDGSAGPAGTGPDLITALLDDAVDQIAACAADISLPQLVEILTRRAAMFKRGTGDDMRLTGGYVFCLFARHHDQIWRVGDCKFHNGAPAQDPVFEAELTSARARAMMIRARLADGQTPDAIRAAPDFAHLIDPLLRDQCKLLNRANHPLSIGAINGVAVPADRIESHPARPGLLAMSSDGYPTLFPTLQASEDALAALLDADPLCIGDNLQCKGLVPGARSFDDRSFISARLEV